MPVTGRKRMRCIEIGLEDSTGVVSSKFFESSSLQELMLKDIVVK